jgi:hypothetical protein
MSAELVRELARVKVLFQLRTIEAVLGFPHAVERDPQRHEDAAACAAVESAPAQGEEA